MENIKTLANCTDIEFLRQTNRIRHSVENWLTVTDIANIRKRLPEFEKIPLDASKEEREAINKRNDELKQEQSKKNMDVILDACLEDHPEETLEVIRLCCFVDPTDDSHSVSYYLGAFTEMLNDENVISFFTSLVSLAEKLGLTI